MAEQPKVYTISVSQRSRKWVYVPLTLMLILTVILFLLQEQARISGLVEWLHVAAISMYVLTFLFVFGVYGKTATQERYLRTTFSLTRDSFCKHVKDWGDTSIVRARIASISESPSGTQVRSVDDDRVFIPASTIGYAELIEELSAGRERIRISEVRQWSRLLAMILVGLITPATIMVMVFTDSARARYWAAGVMVFMLISQYVIGPLLSSLLKAKQKVQ